MALRWSVFFLALASCAAHAAEPITPVQFASLRNLVKPDRADAKWTQIPWGTDLWEARTQAAREGKPILLWEMDGHPLGCV